MKIGSKIIILFLILVILFLNNPTTAEYARWTTDKVKNTENPISALFAGTIGETVLRESTAKRNYYIFSIFEFDGKRTMGIATIFFPLNYSFEKQN